MAVHSRVTAGRTLFPTALAVALACSVPVAAGVRDGELRIAIGPEREQLFQLARAVGEQQAREGVVEYYHLELSVMRCAKRDGGGLRCQLVAASGEEARWVLGSSEDEGRWSEVLWFFRDIRREDRDHRLAGRFSIRGVALDCWRSKQHGERECGLYFSARSDTRDRVELPLPAGSAALDDFMELSERAGVVGSSGLVAERRVRPVRVTCLERDADDCWRCTLEAPSKEVVELELDLAQDAHFQVYTVLDRFQDEMPCGGEGCEPGKQILVSEAELNCWTISQRDLRGCEIIMLRSPVGE